MSRTLMKKDSSYSEFRKKNSLSKTNLHSSMLEIENSLSLLTDEKTQQLSFLQKELQSMTRNRSLSTKTNSKETLQQPLKINIPKTRQPSQGQLQKGRRNSLSQLNHLQTNIKSARSVHFHTLNNTFQIIQESEIHNEQDNGLCEKIQQKYKNTEKILTKYAKPTMLKKKESKPPTKGAPLKHEAKVTIGQLQQIQQRLESAKKNKKGTIKDKKVKQLEVVSKPVLKLEKPLLKAVSESNLLFEGKQKPAMIQSKELKQKILTKAKLQPQTMKTSLMISELNSPTLIPTKMITTCDKQKLMSEFDRLKEAIKNTQICVDNALIIRNMIKSIEGFIN